MQRFHAKTLVGGKIFVKAAIPDARSRSKVRSGSVSPTGRIELIRARSEFESASVWREFIVGTLVFFYCYFTELKYFFRMSKVTVLPANKSAEVSAGELLLDAGEKAGVEMEAGCFNCSCGTCVVEVISGMENLEPPSDEELDVLDAWNKEPEKYRLTCCVKVKDGDITIRAGH
ncbi:MAG: 2Fe-2S iron-sulfur cluster-binding protein [Verrucomicrobiota bacterium]